MDTNKGFGKEADNYRSRLVAMEFKRENSAEYFSATPPLEMMRTILSWAASTEHGGESDKALLYLDVRRAYFHAPAKRDTYIEIPAEDPNASRDMLSKVTAVYRWLALGRDNTRQQHLADAVALKRSFGILSRARPQAASSSAGP